MKIKTRHHESYDEIQVPRHSKGTRGIFLYLRETYPSIPAFEGNLFNMWQPGIGQTLVVNDEDITCDKLNNLLARVTI